MKDWPYPRLVAHRGGGLVAPENTLAALRAGQSLGFRAVEFDVKLAADGVAYLLHDATLDRTTSGSGPVDALSWADLAGLDAGSWLGEAFRGEPPARFDEAARLLRSRDTAANVEIKPVPGTERETGAAVARLAADLWAGSPVPPLLSSFSFEALEAAREAVPHLPRGFISSDPGDEDFARLADLGAVSLHASRRHLTPALVDRTHAAGLRLLVWTVNDPVEARRMFAGGVDGIITDNLRQFSARFPDLL